MRARNCASLAPISRSSYDLPYHERRQLPCTLIAHKPKAAGSADSKKSKREDRMNLRSIAAAACLVAASIAPSVEMAWSQEPKPIKIVVPFSPGAGPDLLARLLGQQVAAAQGPNVVVENRPGGGTVPATEAAARAAPDGTTLLLAAPAFVVNDALKRPGSTPVEQFDPVCQFAVTPMILVVRSDSPYKTLDDLLAAARAKPGELQLVSGGPATSLHFAIEVIKRAAKVDMTYVPYGGTPPAMNALMGGHVTAVVGDYPSLISQLQSGALRPLVTVSDKRIDPLPNVPTLTESGLVNYDAEIFYGLVAPGKTPPAVLARLAEMFTKAAKTPEARAKFAQLGLFPADRCGADWTAYLQRQVQGYARIAARVQYQSGLISDENHARFRLRLQSGSQPHGAAAEIRRRGQDRVPIPAGEG